MKWILLVFSLLATAWASPVVIPDDADQPIEEMGDYYEGDMELTEPQKRAILDGMIDSRTGLLNKRYRWPDNTLVYTFASTVNQEQRDYIELVLRNISGHTCLNFKLRTNEVDYVQVTTDSTGCSSNVGRVRGMQNLRLKSNVPGSGCFRFGTVVHEFIHALGFHHAQSAYNRDDYVSIKWENIRPGREHNFKRRDRASTTMFDLDYDLNSVMHYGGKAFSVNGKPTIVPLHGKTIGQRLGMSDLDIQRLNRMYNCSSGQ